MAEGSQFSLPCIAAVTTKETTTSVAQEAAIFIAWRDSVYQYAISTFNSIENVEDIPDTDDFLNGINPIQW